MTPACRHHAVWFWTLLATLLMFLPDGRGVTVYQFSLEREGCDVEGLR
jgi:hypothetical protein